MATTKGIAVCIGLNAVDPKHYQGWSGNLAACGQTQATWPTSPAARASRSPTPT